MRVNWGERKEGKEELTVLPDIAGEDGLSSAVTNGVASIVGLNDLQLLGGRVLNEPSPSGAKVAGGGGVEVLLELGEAAKVPLNGLLNGTGGLAASVGGQAAPVESVVPDLSRAVEDGTLRGLTLRNNKERFRDERRKKERGRKEGREEEERSKEFFSAQQETKTIELEISRDLTTHFFLFSSIFFLPYKAGDQRGLLP